MRRSKLREDVAERAYRTLQEALGERPKTVPPSERTNEQKDPEASARGRSGGRRGGSARAASLTKRRRSAIAKAAAKKRWSTARRPPTRD